MKMQKCFSKADIEMFAQLVQQDQTEMAVRMSNNAAETFVERVLSTLSRDGKIELPCGCLFELETEMVDDSTSIIVDPMASVGPAGEMRTISFKPVIVDKTPQVVPE